MYRRSFLKAAAALSAAVQFGSAFGDQSKAHSRKAFKRIATEEAMLIPEILDEWRIRLKAEDESEPGFRSTVGAYIGGSYIDSRLIDLGPMRLAEMDATGIDMQILSIASPGVQVFDHAKAADLAKKTNDRMAEAIATHPDRFTGLAAVAPQNPREAARELERAVQNLGLKGALINSHTKGEYLDDPKFWPIFETAQGLDVPVYIHPREPSPQMLEPYLERGIQSAGWGFAAETGLHTVRLLVSGVFDEFPGLKIILGHMGEMIPYWLPRIDGLGQRDHWAPGSNNGKTRRLKKLPSEYFKNNFFITTSAADSAAWHPAFMLAYEVLGADRILFAVDYPFGSGEGSVAFLDTAPIPDSDKEKIYHRNAETLFRL
jgi:2,3-dihydroxybenzoate decarboxylase